MNSSVDQISLRLEPGHVYAMLGPNGSDKTTWMKMAAGLIKPTSGEMLFEGAPVSIESRRFNGFISFLIILALFWLTGWIGIKVTDPIRDIRTVFLVQSAVALALAVLMYFLTARIMETKLSV